MWVEARIYDRRCEEGKLSSVKAVLSDGRRINVLFDPEKRQVEAILEEVEDVEVDAKAEEAYSLFVADRKQEEEVIE